ncbi:MAG: 5-(carboxyamino)imidazole ribonucleotide mutase [Clostridia bacterium]|nr:5-(carboxyamino)imidazole ribonucleotide mutase [Clostridia bacterium]
MKKIAVIMGSDSDLPVVEAAFAVFKEYDVPFCAHIFSAHRTPDAAARFAAEAKEQDYGVLIAAAGMAAHLAGALAARTTLPVIGLPIKAGALGGMDALLATVQMPPGMPVATVGVDAAVNAALLAVEILAVSEPELAEKLTAARRQMAEKVLNKDAALQEKLRG